MAYSIMLWLVNPGCQAHETEALEMLKGQRSRYPGALCGINAPPAATRLVYGLYDDERDAQRGLEKIEDHLEKGESLRVELMDGTVFVVPASRVHYAVLCEAVRPKDTPKARKELEARGLINR